MKLTAFLDIYIFDISSDMAKRKAVTDLNHENWDREEKPETAGKFQRAPKEVLQSRVIRTAKRRLHKSGTPSAVSN